MVAAALLSPKLGSSAKITTRMPMVYPASAALPKPAMIRTSPIQLAIPTSDWNAAAPESRVIWPITRKSSPR